MRSLHFFTLIPMLLPSPTIPLSTTDQVLNGESWVIVDGAIVDVSTFYGRHPGGSRVIMNALGTDITGELLGEDRSIGNTVSSPPQHPHSKVGPGQTWPLACTGN